jgi:hypothetical protein
MLCPGCSLGPRQTMARAIKLYKVPDHPATPGMRRMEEKDVPQVQGRTWHTDFVVCGLVYTQAFWLAIGWGLAAANACWQMLQDWTATATPQCLGLGLMCFKCVSVWAARFDTHAIWL